MHVLSILSMFHALTTHGSRMDCCCLMGMIICSSVSSIPWWDPLSSTQVKNPHGKTPLSLSLSLICCWSINTVWMNTTRECGFSYTKSCGSWHMCPVNFVVSSITFVLRVPLPNVKLLFLCNICHNKHHILYIVMNETTRVTSHMCHELQLFVWEKPQSLVVEWLMSQKSRSKTYWPKIHRDSKEIWSTKTTNQQPTKRAVCKCDHNKEGVSTLLNTKFPPHFDG